jgi:ParB-like nuclease domain
MLAPRKVVFVAIGKLRPNPRNSRTHTKKQIGQVANSILRFGWTYPILVDEKNVILAGHARRLAAQQLGYREVPVTIVSGLSNAEKRALAIADNKIASNAGWDRELLAEELGELSSLLPECKLDLEITGFEGPEIHSLLGDVANSEINPADHVPSSKTKPVGPHKTKAVSRIGDLWELGPHKVLCGDALSAKDLGRLAGTQSAMIVMTGNLPMRRFQGHGLRNRGNLAQGSGEMSSAQFMHFLRSSLSPGTKSSVIGAINFIVVDGPHAGKPLAAGSLLAPRYADAAVRRWQAHTRRDAILATTRQTFDHVAAVRSKPGRAP